MMYFILTFFLGSAIGSFVNVLIDRTMKDENWVSGRSHCDYCRKTLAWYDLIPIVSFVIYRGKSRCCHSPLSYRYPIVEMMVGLLFVWWLAVGFWFFRLVSAPLTIIQPGFWLMSGIILAILTVADLFYGVVLLNIVWIGSLLVALYRLVLWYYQAYNPRDLAVSIVVGAIFYAGFWALYKMTKGQGMAEGDMYVAMYMGILLGWPKGLVALLASFVLGAVIGILLIVSGVKTRKDNVPFVPFMTSGIVIALLFGDQIIGFLG